MARGGLALDCLGPNAGNYMLGTTCWEPNAGNQMLGPTCWEPNDGNLALYETLRITMTDTCAFIFLATVPCHNGLDRTSLRDHAPSDAKDVLHGARQPAQIVITSTAPRW